MKSFLVLLVLCASCAAIVVSLQSATAHHACVTVSVSTFVGGESTKGTCRPVPGPADKPFVMDHCDSFPQAGVKVCETVDVHVPG